MASRVASPSELGTTQRQRADPGIPGPDDVAAVALRGTLRGALVALSADLLGNLSAIQGLGDSLYAFAEHPENQPRSA